MYDMVMCIGRKMDQLMLPDNKLHLCAVCVCVSLRSSHNIVKLCISMGGDVAIDTWLVNSLCLHPSREAEEPAIHHYQGHCLSWPACLPACLPGCLAHFSLAASAKT